MQPVKEAQSFGFAGQLAAKFQNNALTPLLAIVALLMGLFAVLVTPREEEPNQCDHGQCAHSFSGC
ncbi:MAG: Multidrug resistance protein MdtC [Pseudomonadota bacterium]